MDADNHGRYLERVSDFAYDPRDRLAQVIRTDPGTGGQVGSETYTHDASNNVISQTIDGVTTDSVYDRNRLHATVTDGVTSAYNYDPFGRLDTVTAGGQTTQRYLYDGFDRIIEQHTDGVIARKTYDPLDRTTTETTNAGTPEAETTLFTYLGLSEQVLTEQVDGQITTSYQHDPAGRLLSQTKHDTDGTSEDSFYGYNPHGDVAGITDETGNSRATYGYTAYGSDDQSLFTGVDKPDPANPEAQDPYNAYRYAGQHFDHATGTYDMGFSDYDPGLNRFLARDTFNGALADMHLTTNPWTLSRYTFAGGNPTTLVEYDGHIASCTPDGYSYCPNYIITDQPQAPSEVTASTPQIEPADPSQVYFYELPEGGPSGEYLAEYIEEWLGLPHVPDPINALGPTVQHSIAIRSSQRPRSLLPIAQCHHGSARDDQSAQRSFSAKSTRISMRCGTTTIIYSLASRDVRDSVELLPSRMEGFGSRSASVAVVVVVVQQSDLPTFRHGIRTVGHGKPVPASTLDPVRCGERPLTSTLTVSIVVTAGRVVG